MPLAAYLPQDRRRALAAGHALPTACRGAAMFSDISGFTALSELLTQHSGQRHGADELVRRINSVHQVLIDEIERAGGSVVAFAGDGMTCWFDDAEGDGAGAANGTQRAAAAAVAMQRAMQGFATLSVKIGIAAGPAARLVVGDASIQLIDLLAGATVARAVAAENVSRAGEVLVDAAAAAALAVPGQPVPGIRRDTALGPAWCLDLAALAALPGLALGPPPAAGPDGVKSLSGASSPARPEALRPWVLPFVFERETSSGGLFATDLRPATALFVRVPLGADDAPASSALAALVTRIQRTLWQHGGVLLEVAVDAVGTCLYGNFGAAQAHEDDARRALQAALLLQRGFDDDGVAAHIGLASGTLCVGGYGAAGRRSFGAIGDAVNAAARLMAQAAPGEVLVAFRVRQPQAGEDFAFEARAPLWVKGKAEPVPVFAASAVQRRRAIRLEEPLSALPMVGRQAETAVLAAAVAQVLAGRGQRLRIVAEAGMGKSRLVAEGIRLARRAGVIGYGGACRVEGSRTPYLAWQAVWTAFFDLDPALPQRRQRQAAQAALQRLAPQQAEAWPLLADVLGQDWPDTAMTATLQPKDRKTLLHLMLRQSLHAAAAEAAADGMALMLVLEDLHAADPLSLELLAELSRDLDPHAVLLLVSERLDEPAPTAAAARDRALAGAQRVELQGITPADIDLIVRAKLAQRFPERSGPVPRELLDSIAARAQGNPFFVLELLDYLHDRGIDPRRAEAVQALDLPSSLHSLVLTRIDQLSPAQRNALKAASVIGRQFAVDELQGYCPSLGSLQALGADLDELARLGFAPALPDPPEPERRCHVFRHRVTQDVVYDSIALETRAWLHGQYAQWLQARHGDDRSLAALLAHHFERAERSLGRAPACHYLRLAGQQAAARFANDEALAHFDKALAWLPPDDTEGRYALLLERHPLLDLLGRHDRQRDDLQALAALAAQAGPGPAGALRQARVAMLQVQLEIQLGSFAAAHTGALAVQALLDAAEAATAGPADAALQAQRLEASLLQGKVLVLTGEVAAARSLLEATLAAAQAQGLVAAQAQALSRLGHLLWQGGDYDAAEQRFGQALARARDNGDLRLQLNLANSLGVVAKSRSRFAEAAQRYDEALQIARRIGDRSGQAMLLNNQGSACLAAGRFHEARGHCEHAARIFADAGETVMHGLALTNCAEAHRELGQAAPALQLATQALAWMRSSGSRPGEALALENLGLAQAAAGQAEAAAASLRESVRLAADIASPTRQASALLHLGRVLAEKGAETGPAGPSAAGSAAESAAALDEAERLAAALPDEALTRAIAAQQALRCLPDDVPAAVARIEALLPLLLAGPAPGAAGAEGLPLGLHAAALRVLRSAGDPRHAALLPRSRQALAEQAAMIPDDQARRSFLALPTSREVAGPA